MSRKIITVAMIAFMLSFSANAATGKKMTEGQYVGGGIASIFVGFGVGAAIHDRYEEIGWIFTVSELGALAMLVTGFSVNGPYVPFFGYIQPNAGGITLISVGTAALAGLRAWEIVDTWLTPKKQNMVAEKLYMPKQKLAFSPIVSPNFVGLNLRF